MTCKQEPAGAKPPLVGLLKYQILYQSNATPVARAANVLHARWASAANHSLADLVTLLSFLEGQWDGFMGPSISGAWFHIGGVLTSLGGDGLATTHSENIAGGNGSVPFPPQTAVCVSWKSGITARGGRARTYLPGVPQSAVTTPNNAALTTAFTTGLKDGALSFMAAVNTHTVGGDTVNLGVPSYYNKCAIRPVPIFFPFVDAVVHERLDSQRRRSGKESTFPTM